LPDHHSTNTLAAVVTYNPDDSLGLHLQTLKGQADDVLVVDNGSANVAWVEEIAAAHGCMVLKNGSNEGIAKALNQAAEVAVDRGYRWLATFDQDSLATEGLLAGLVDLYLRQPAKARVAVMCASHIDRHTGSHYHVPENVLIETGEWRLLRTAITSGSLIPTSVFREIGSFDERLFIDFVDHDFCVRCRQHGMSIMESKTHVLIHSLGNITQHRLLWRPIVCSNHSALRRYYMTRNQLEVYRRYLWFDVAWSVRGLLNLLVGSALVLVFETQKMAKLRAMARGTLDFVLRRFGPVTYRTASAEPR
jgi:rhamnosyltransferase